MFQTDHLAYEKLPSDEEAAKLIKKGEQLYVIDDGKLPQSILKNDLIQKLNIKESRRN